VTTSCQSNGTMVVAAVMTLLRILHGREQLGHNVCAIGLLLHCACGEPPAPVAPAKAPAPALPAPRPEPTEPPAFAALPCPPPGADDALERTEPVFRAAALKPAFEADYLSVRRQVPSAPRQTLAQRGNPCVGAVDAAECTRGLERLEQRFVATAAKCERLDCAGAVYVLTTRAGEPRLWSKAEELPTLLGAIDTPAEAWLVAQMALGALPYLCGDAEFSAQRATPAGFELRERRYTQRCRPAELAEFVYRIASDGSAQQLSRTVVHSDPTACMSDEGVVQQPKR
jgi:hypothetical protein